MRCASEAVIRSQLCHHMQLEGARLIVRRAIAAIRSRISATIGDDLIHCLRVALRHDLSRQSFSGPKHHAHRESDLRGSELAKSMRDPKRLGPLVSRTR
jgi:hypothetical protein